LSKIRYESRPEAFRLLVAQVQSPEWADLRPAAGGWSAREHVAHLGRHAEVFKGRLARILREAKPAVGRYRAEDDPEWPAWAALSWEAAVDRWHAARGELSRFVAALSPGDLGRTGLHPTFGELAIAQWLEFFLLHEAHHLYTALVRVGEARRRI
jgi:hypothetical protein